MNKVDRCTHDYIERDGSATHCTREANHYGACYWPQLPEWRRRAMTDASGTLRTRIEATREIAR